MSTEHNDLWAEFQAAMRDLGTKLSEFMLDLERRPRLRRMHTAYPARWKSRSS